MYWKLRSINPSLFARGKHPFEWLDSAQGIPPIIYAGFYLEPGSTQRNCEWTKSISQHFETMVEAIALVTIYRGMVSKRCPPGNGGIRHARCSANVETRAPRLVPPVPLCRPVAGDSANWPLLTWGIPELGPPVPFYPLFWAEGCTTKIDNPEAPGAFNGRPDPSIRHPGNRWLGVSKPGCLKALNPSGASGNRKKGTLILSSQICRT